MKKMKIELSDVGRVKNAEAVLEGITVVAGNNGSGKSTISKSLYTVLEASYDLQGKIAQQQRRGASDVLGRWLTRIPVKSERTFNRLSAALMALRTKGLNKLQFYARVSRVFEGMDKNELEEVIEGMYADYLILHKKTPEQYNNFVTQVIVDGVFTKQINTVNRATIARIECEIRELLEIEIEKQEVKLAQITEQYIQPVYITTSDLIDTVGNNEKLYSAQQSGGVSYANAKLVELLMKEKSAKDFTLEEYESLQEQKRQMEGILQQILEGDMHVEKRNLVYYDDWAGDNIAFGNVASGVRIFLILKKLIDNGVFLKPTCLIIDEPETNLHPEWQLRLAELLVLLYQNMGVKVYTNTHSPYFARAIEFYAHKYNELDKCRFYLMRPFENTGMYATENVTEKLGLIYDMLAEPFNKIM